MNTDVLFSSKTDDWETPQYIFDDLNDEFDFGIDVCASESNRKCLNYFDVNDDGLKKSWCGFGNVWCNPPYGRKIQNWVKKASETADQGYTTVMLIPARTDTCWFHDFIYQKENVEVRFIQGRLKFGGAKYNAPFPSMIVVFRSKEEEKSIETGGDENCQQTT